MKILVDFTAHADAWTRKNDRDPLDVNDVIRGLRAIAHREPLLAREELALGTLLAQLETADEWDEDAFIEPIVADARSDGYEDGRTDEANEQADKLDELLANARADAFNEGYAQGRSDTEERWRESVELAAEIGR